MTMTNLGLINISRQQLEVCLWFKTNRWKLFHQSINWKEEDDPFHNQPCQTKKHHDHCECLSFDEQSFSEVYFWRILKIWIDLTDILCPHLKRRLLQIARQQDIGSFCMFIMKCKYNIATQKLLLLHWYTLLGPYLDSIADSVFVKIGWDGQILYQHQNKRSQ